jgi:hypothetical protein
MCHGAISYQFVINIIIISLSTLMSNRQHSKIKGRKNR